jgi:hypothetical protein
LLIVGLAANKTTADWAFATLLVVPVRVLTWMKTGPAMPAPMVIAEPEQNLSEIRAVAAEVLPGVRIRRGLYWRYLMRWTKPE